MSDPLNQPIAPKKPRSEEDKLGLSIDQPQIAGAQPGYLSQQQTYAYAGTPAKPTGTGITQKTAGAGQYLSANAGQGQQLTQRAVQGIGKQNNYTYGQSALDASILGNTRNFQPTVQAPARSSADLLAGVENTAYGNAAANTQVNPYGEPQTAVNLQGMANYLQGVAPQMTQDVVGSNASTLAQALDAEGDLQRQGELQGNIKNMDFGALQEVLTRGISEGDYANQAQHEASTGLEQAAKEGVGRRSRELQHEALKYDSWDTMQKDLDAKRLEAAREPNAVARQSVEAEIADIEQRMQSLGIRDRGIARQAANTTDSNVSKTANLLDEINQFVNGEHSAVGVGTSRRWIKQLEELGIHGYKDIHTLGYDGLKRLAKKVKARLDQYGK